MKRKILLILVMLTICLQILLFNKIFSNLDAIAKEYTTGICLHHKEHDEECGFLATSLCNNICEICEKDNPHITYHANYPKGTDSKNKSAIIDKSPKTSVFDKKAPNDGGYFEGPSIDDGVINDGDDDDNSCLTFTAPTAEQAGFYANDYTFVGWSDKPDALYAIWNGGDEIRIGDSMELYAVWTAIDLAAEVDSYQIVYHSGNGRGNDKIVENPTGVFKLLTDSGAGFSAPTGMSNTVIWLGWAVDIEETDAKNASFGENGNAYSLVEYFSDTVITNLGDNVILKTVTNEGASMKAEKPEIHLYAIYGYQAVKGYSLSISGAYFDDKAATENGQKPIYYANTKDGVARKYFAANGGYPDGTTETRITVSSPTNDDKSKLFMGWYDKKADSDELYFSLQGDKVRYEGNKIYSHDAMWATLDADEDALKRNVDYDAKTHTLHLEDGMQINIDGLGTDINNKPGEERISDFQNAMNPSFSLEIQKKNNNNGYKVAKNIYTGEELKDIYIPVTERRSSSITLFYMINFEDVIDQIGQFLAGEYKYIFTPVLENTNRDDPESPNGHVTHKLDPIEGVLTITPATLKISKSVKVSATPGETIKTDFGYGKGLASGVSLVDVSGLIADDVLDLDLFASLMVTASLNAGESNEATYSKTLTAPWSNTFESDGTIRHLQITNDNENYIEEMKDRSDCYTIIVDLRLIVAVDVLGTLKIVVIDGEQNENFLYKIENSDKSISLIVSVKSHSSTTIVVPLGEYTVQEISNWSWKYDDGIPDRDETIIISQENKNQTITYSHNRNEMNWLGGENTSNNLFE